MLAGLGKLSLSTGYILAGIFSCDPQAPPAVSINFQNNPPQFNNEHSSEFMAQMKSGSLSPEHGGEFPIVDGITAGSFQAEHSMDFSSLIRPFMRKACVGVKAINITLAYSAIVYVDKRYPPGSCRYELTKDHEMKHVNTDVVIINEFIPYIQQMVQATAAQWQNMAPIAEDQLETAENNMSKQISGVLDSASDSMQRMRGARQPQIDSHEEYTRVSEACPDER